MSILPVPQKRKIAIPAAYRWRKSRLTKFEYFPLYQQHRRAARKSIRQQSTAS
ncbi:hypothetical protein KCP75_16410 [Salmonella enterica subsp. enterica]|nr:hypothetical protein KCP75_16410 [Salmonella enterica subsp. enterica]